MRLARVVPLLMLLPSIGCGSSAHQTATAPQSPKRTGTRTSTTSSLAIPTGAGNLAAVAGSHGLTLRDRPGGKVIGHLGPETAWGSPTVVWATERRGRWLGVIATALHNNQVGWLDVRHDRPRMWRSQLSLHADLSARTLELRRGSRVVRRIPIGIGDPNTPTPLGRFSVTDKLAPGRELSFYGCCLLALSGHQSHLRPG